MKALSFIITFYRSECDARTAWDSLDDRQKDIACRLYFDEGRSIGAAIREAKRS